MPDVYLYANVKLRYGQLAAFSETMAKVKDLYEAQGWQLEAAYQTIIGNFHEVHDVWKLPDANSVLDAMTAAAAHPSFAVIAPELAEEVIEETVSLVTKTSYSP